MRQTLSEGRSKFEACPTARGHCPGCSTGLRCALLMRRTCSLLVLALLLAATSSVAQAQRDSGEPARAELRFTHVQGCADEATFRTMVEQVLERQVFVAAAEADLAVHASFVRGAEGWNAILTLSERGALVGRREISSEDPSCETLTGPASLVVALMVDAHRPRLQLRVPKVSIPKPAPVKRVVTRRWSARTGLSLRSSYGALPGFAAGLTLDSVLISPTGVPFQAALTLWPTDESSENGVGGRFRLWHAGVGLCPSWDLGRARAGFCTGLQAGQLEGEGMGLSHAKEPRHFWIHAEARADLGVRLMGPLGLHVSAGLAMPFNRPEFVYNAAKGGTVQVHRPWPIVPMAGIGLEANLSP